MIKEGRCTLWEQRIIETIMWMILSIFLIMSLSTSLTLAYTSSTAHIRGPHHPRGPKSEGHHHYHPQRDTAQQQPILTHDKQLLHDTEHLKEDLGEWAFTDGKEMSAEEMEFHYFKAHDFDNNSKLDGLEILQAISHILPMYEGVDEGNSVDLTQSQTNDGDSYHIDEKKKETVKQKEEDFNYYIDLIDKVLQEDDTDKDGYLSYVEYVLGREKDEARMKSTINKSIAGPHSKNL